MPILITKAQAADRITIRGRSGQVRQIDERLLDPRELQGEFAEWYSQQRPVDDAVIEPDDADGTINMFDRNPELRDEVRRRDRAWLARYTKRTP
jgi:hypothetical protein